jgi:hypothetical protein
MSAGRSAVLRFGAGGVSPHSVRSGQVCVQTRPKGARPLPMQHICLSLRASRLKPTVGEAEMGDP